MKNQIIIFYSEIIMFKILLYNMFKVYVWVLHIIIIFTKYKQNDKERHLNINFHYTCIVVQLNFDTALRVHYSNTTRNNSIMILYYCSINFSSYNKTYYFNK